MISGFGTKAIGVLIRADEWSEIWGVDPSASLTFFAALPAILTAQKLIPSESSVREAFVEMGCEEAGQTRWHSFLDELARDAASKVVTVNDVARYAWTLEGQRILDAFSSLRLGTPRIERLLHSALTETAIDQPPPTTVNARPRFEVVIKGEHGEDASNQYATFDDAQRALASLSKKYFNGVRPSVHGENPVIIVIRGRIGKPRSAWIREVRASPDST